MYILEKIVELNDNVITFYVENIKRKFKNGYVTGRDRFNVKKCLL